MARPPIDDLDRRTVWMKYRASPTEAACIDARCKQAGLSRSAFHRELALKGAIIQREPLADRQLMRQLGAIGNNLNQISRSLHINPDVDTVLYDDLKRALTAHSECLDRMMA